MPKVQDWLYGVWILGSKMLAELPMVISLLPVAGSLTPAISGLVRVVEKSAGPSRPVWLSRTGSSVVAATRLPLVALRVAETLRPGLLSKMPLNEAPP